MGCAGGGRVGHSTRVVGLFDEDRRELSSAFEVTLRRSFPSRGRPVLRHQVGHRGLDPGPRPGTFARPRRRGGHPRDHRHRHASVLLRGVGRTLPRPAPLGRSGCPLHAQARPQGQRQGLGDRLIGPCSPAGKILTFRCRRPCRSRTAGFSLGSCGCMMQESSPTGRNKPCQV
jgi:hypothetical protein